MVNPPFQPLVKDKYLRIIVLAIAHLVAVSTEEVVLLGLHSTVNLQSRLTRSV